MLIDAHILARFLDRQRHLLVSARGLCLDVRTILTMPAPALSSTGRRRTDITFAPAPATTASSRCRCPVGHDTRCRCASAAPSPLVKAALT
jgi:hypothetical protein